MGRPTARLARTPSHSARTHSRGIFRGRKRPLCPSRHAGRGFAGQRRAATSPPPPARPNPERRGYFAFTLPCPGTYTLRPSLCWHPPTHIGVLPLFSVRHRKGRGEGEVGEKEGRAGERGRARDAADAPRPETAPVAARKEEEAVRVGEEAGPEQGPGRRRAHLRHREHQRHATFYLEPATTTPPP
jgi:hypothetical protein